jgi:hypothetical protein
MPYHARNQVETKLRQTEFAWKQLSKFRNKVFVDNGLDKETGAYPIRTSLSSFLTEARSVLQSVWKEMKQAGRQSEYARLVTSHPVFGFFKGIRDSDIHEYVPSIHTTVSMTSRISRSAGKGAKPETAAESVPAPADPPSEPTVTVSLGKRLEPTPDFLSKLAKEGRSDLVEAAKRGETLYEQLEFDGQSDMFVLCEGYLKELKDLVADCATRGLIT